MGQLRKMFGANIPEPVAYVATRWHADEFTRGSYSYHAVGSSPKDRCVRMWFSFGMIGIVFSAGYSHKARLIHLVLG